MPCQVYQIWYIVVGWSENFKRGLCYYNGLLWVPFSVKLFYSIESMLAQLDISWGLTAPLIFVCWDVYPMSFKVTKAWKGERYTKFKFGYICNVVNQGVHKLSYSHELPGHRHPSVQLVWHNDHCNGGMACLDSKHNGRYWGHILDGYPHMSNSIVLLLLLWSLFKNKNETDLSPACMLYLSISSNNLCPF